MSDIEYIFRVSFDVRVFANDEADAEAEAWRIATDEHKLDEGDPHMTEVQFAELIVHPPEPEFDCWQDYDFEHGTHYCEDLFGVR